MKSILTILIFLNVENVFACMPSPALYARVKNNLLVSVANDYGFDILDAKIEIENYKHKMEWRFTDSSYQCHDADIATAKISMLQTKETLKGIQTCSVILEVKQVTAPTEAKGARSTETESIVIQPYSCQ